MSKEQGRKQSKIGGGKKRVAKKHIDAMAMETKAHSVLLLRNGFLCLLCLLLPHLVCMSHRKPKSLSNNESEQKCEKKG